MTNAQILAKAILDIELVIGEHLHPGHPRDAMQLIDELLAVIEDVKAVDAAHRVQKGFTGPHSVK